MNVVRALAVIATAGLELGIIAHATSGGGVRPADAAPPRIAIDVTEAGFTPPEIDVARGQRVTLVFTRRTDRTCAREVVLEVGGRTIEKALPLGKPVELAVTFPKRGTLTYTCGMDMVHGLVAVR